MGEEKRTEVEEEKVFSAGKNVFFDGNNGEGKWTKWREKKAESGESGDDELNDVIRKLKAV